MGVFFSLFLLFWVKDKTKHVISTCVQWRSHLVLGDYYFTLPGLVALRPEWTWMRKLTQRKTATLPSKFNTDLQTTEECTLESLAPKWTPMQSMWARVCVCAISILWHCLQISLGCFQPQCCLQTQSDALMAKNTAIFVPLDCPTLLFAMLFYFVFCTWSDLMSIVVGIVYDLHLMMNVYSFFPWCFISLFLSII